MNLAARVLIPLAIAPTPRCLGAVVHTLGGLTMGTRWQVRLSGPARLALPTLQAGLQSALDGLVAQMSPWEPDSHISRFNSAPAGSWHALPEDFATVMQAALQVARASGGAFDPSAGELVNLWGFGPPGPVAQPPARGALADALARSGWQRLQADAPAGPARPGGAWLHQPGGCTLDLSAIAKGHAVDVLSRHLSRLGFDDHLVEVGGELRGAGVKPDGQPWWVDLQVPPGLTPRPGLTRVALHGLSVATSGDYLRWRDDGRGGRVSHTIDPRTGQPATNGLTSVSVLHRDGLWADAWSTALMVLGPEAGLALAEREGLAALLVERRGSGWLEHASSGLKALAE